jgi:ATP-dependent DNA ligase
LPDEDDEALAARHSRVDQVPLQHRVVLYRQGNDNGRIFRAKSGRATPTGTIPTRRRAELAPPPNWIRPQLAKLVEKAPDGPDSLHELKLDGYRMHARLDAGKCKS